MKSYFTCSLLPSKSFGSIFDKHCYFTDNTESESARNTLSNTSSGRSSRSSQSPSKSLSAISSSTNSSNPAAQTPLPHINFPIQDEYDFRLACRQCFVKIGEGVKGYKYDTASHLCTRDTLIVRKRGAQNVNWIKIRPRPDVKGHFGGYKLCTQFTQNKPCKVSEEKCTFPHTTAELMVWSKDREAAFSINNFMAVCQQYKICKFLYCHFCFSQNLLWLF